MLSAQFHLVATLATRAHQPFTHYLQRQVFGILDPQPSGAPTVCRYKSQLESSGQHAKPTPQQCFPFAAAHGVVNRAKSWSIAPIK
ncbi:hypothetical protein D3C86_1781940 [compost metagenome]